MPKVKKDSVWFTSDVDGRNFMEFEIHVNAEGIFYARLNNKVYGAVATKIFGTTKVSGDFINCFNASMDRVHDLVLRTFKATREPEVKTEIVILYNVESHVSFAIRDDGEIARNAVNATWCTSEKKYGNHHSTNPASGGYSMTIGARVVRKNTYTYGEKSTVKYEYFSGNDNESKQLNSWCSFSLPDDANEMPYTPEAALFFDNLMLGIAKMNKMMQEMIGTEDQILALANNNTKLLG